MHGVPVIVAGETHYRGKGFTDDPNSWEEYVQILETRLQDKAGTSISEEAVKLAWHYAYRYFFDYPFVFPWHLISFWQDISDRPFEEVVRPESIQDYRVALDAFIGQPIDWKVKAQRAIQAEVTVEE